jgi:HAE1 family hydrophobic/amphiphilic exporter-1
LGIISILALGAVIIPPSPIFPLVFIFFLICLFIAFQVRTSLVSRVKVIRSRQRTTWFIEKFNDGFINIEDLSKKYKYIIDKILSSKSARRNTILAICVFAIVGYALIPLGFVKSEFFPKTDEDILYVQVDLPSGTNIAITNKEMYSFVESVKKTTEVNYIIADSGVSMGANDDRTEETGSFLLTVHLYAKEKRKHTSQEIAEYLREETKQYAKGKVSVFELSGGPPAGADVQISLLGDDLIILDQYADKLIAFLRKQKNITNVATSNKASTSKIVFVPDKTRLAEVNMTPATLGLWLRTYASGFTLDTIKLQNEDTDISFRMGEKTKNPDSLSSILIPTQTSSIQLSSLGKFQLKTNPTQIVRENGKRRVSVTASVTNGVSSTEKSNELLKYAESFKLPEGYSWATGGINEENTKSVQSILQAMILSILLILVTMVIEFGSFRQTFIALLIIPLAVSGVFYIFALTGTPLSFPALIGILALFGIVVTHAIVVIEKINENRKHGMNVHDALVDASGNRLEPVLLTSLATIVGLIPITLADPLWRGLGGAIIAGLLFSGAIKLFFVPVLYYNWFHVEDEKKDENLLSNK